MSFGLCIDVIDPLNRTGKIRIPNRCVEETRGIVDFQNARQIKDLSLCLLFQRGQCNAGSKCRQVHADPNFVNHLRSQVAGSNCCAAHGDVSLLGYSEPMQNVKFVRVINGSCTQTYTITAFARTASLDKVLSASKDGTASVLASRLCRLHQLSRCKFGKDCNNIHLCRQPSPFVAPTASTFPISKIVPPTALDVSETGDSSSTRSESPHPVAPLDCRSLELESTLMLACRAVDASSNVLDFSEIESTLRVLCADLCQCNVKTYHSPTRCSIW